MASTQVFNTTTKSFCVVTGASRGIGRAIAVALSKKFTPGSVMCVTGRSTNDLRETQRLIQTESQGIHVNVVTTDLADEAYFPRFLTALTKDVNPSDFQRSFLINNAATLGDVSRFVRQLDASDLKHLQEYYMINLTSAVLLTAHYLKIFPKADGSRRTVVNLTAIADVFTTPCSSVYGMGKAAREMFFKTVAREEPDARILNYSPGAVDTKMLRELMENTADSNSRQMLVNLDCDQKLLTPEQTAAMLVKILEDDTYESGTLVDYNDMFEKDITNSS